MLGPNYKKQGECTSYWFGVEIYLKCSGFLAMPELVYLQIKGKSPILTQIKQIFTFSKQFGTESHNLHDSK